jgi:hypothetical protein
MLLLVLLDCFQEVGSKAECSSLAVVGMIIVLLAARVISCGRAGMLGHARRRTAASGRSAAGWSSAVVVVCYYYNDYY